MPTKPQANVWGGHFYGRRSARAPLEQIPGDEPPRAPDAWICRRLVDFPHGQAPAGGALATCARCAAVIVYNPKRPGGVPADTPKICMQCNGIQPLPIDG